MEVQAQEASNCKPDLVKVAFCLGSEKHSASSNRGGAISEQLSGLKDASMAILKEYITKNNVPIEVPDEPLEMSSSEDDNEVLEKPKKTKRN